MAGAVNAPWHTRQRDRSERLNKLVNDYQAEHGSQAVKATGDLGSHLYRWYLKQTDTESYVYLPEDDSIRPSDLPSVKSAFKFAADDVNTQLANPKTVMRERPQRYEPTVTNGQISKRRKLSLSSSPTTSNAEMVFSPTQHSNHSATSRTDSVSSRISIAASNTKKPSSQAHQDPHPPYPATVRASIQSPIPSLSPVNDDFGSKPICHGRSKPQEISEAPNTWDDTHAADKMMIAMRQDHNWEQIAEKWKQWTGNSDSAGHLQWRYKMLKKKLAIVTDADFRRLLKKDVASRYEGDQSRSLATFGDQAQSKTLYIDLDEVDTDNDVIEMTFEKANDDCHDSSFDNKRHLRREKEKKMPSKRYMPNRSILQAPWSSQDKKPSLWVCLKVPTHRPLLSIQHHGAPPLR